MEKPCLIDTCTVSQYLSPRARERNPELIRRIDACSNRAMAYVTHYELRRGLLKVEAKGPCPQLRIATEKLLRTWLTLGLDGPWGGWGTAAELWSAAQRHVPAINIKETDLQIAATALHHRRLLITSDRKLYDRMRELGHKETVEYWPVHDGAAQAE